MAVEVVTFRIVGTMPLMMHNVRLASPLNAYAKEMKRLTSAKSSAKRTDDDRLALARVEWEGGLYHDETLGPYIPAPWVWRALVDAGRMGRQGKTVEAAVRPRDLMNPLVYAGPRTVAEMWGNGTSPYVDMQSVRVGTSRVDRCRPIFPVTPEPWSASIAVVLDTATMNRDQLVELMGTVGSAKGIGEYRQWFGRFKVSEVTTSEE